MAQFYGTIQGGRGEATRCGTKNSGMRTTCESWSTILEAQAFHAAGEDHVDVRLKTKYGNTIFSAGVNGERLARVKDDPRVTRALRGLEESFRNVEAAAEHADPKHGQDREED